MIIRVKEADEQTVVFKWAEFCSARRPELKLLYHIPNGGLRSKAEAARFKREGVKAGVPDICLPVARGRFHGLYIELKAKDGGVISDEQKAWLSSLAEQGYCAVVCIGAEKAIDVIEKYLKGAQ